MFWLVFPDFGLSLTLEDYFHIHLLKGESFSVLTLNLDLTFARTSILCITTILEPIVVQSAEYFYVYYV